MEKSVKITSIIVAGVIVLALLGYLVSNSSVSEKNTVTGNGYASIDVIPDLVKVYFNVETTGKTSAEAGSANAKIVDDLTVGLIKEGFNRDEIQTQNYNINPEYDWINGKQVDKGFRATHSIVVEMPTSESDKIGTAIDAGINAGAMISYINFELSPEKENQYKADAIKQAAEDARVKAQALAEGVDAELGDRVSVSEGGFGYTPWRAYGEVAGASDATMAKEAATNIQPSEQTVTASVTVVYKLK
jgi:uncharacterized protein